ncbi:MAG TPA: hypothetical protein DCO79_16355 [Spirochaeta sp.]|nr:hypothetical protein [Spirochaeta sp.]
MKYFCTIIIILTVVFTLSCESAGAGDSSFDDNQYLNITSPFTPGNYSGFLDKKSDDIAGFVDSRLTFDNTIYASFSADGYFQLDYTFDNSEGELPPYFYMKLTKAGETVSSWLTAGNHSDKIWLRLGAGVYTVNIYKVSTTPIISSYGVIQSFSYEGTPVCIFQVENTNSEDGRFIYPSPEVQSDDAELLTLSASFTGTTADELIKEIHDWLICYLYYDTASVTFADRRQQDAQSVYSYGAAVCEGYTSLFMALLRGRGIPVQYISGTANGGNHAWNNVFNGTEWKLIDPTWDDPLIDTGSGETSNYPDGFNLRYNYYWMDNLADHSPIDYYTTRSAVPANPIY